MLKAEIVAIGMVLWALPAAAQSHGGPGNVPALTPPAITAGMHDLLRLDNALRERRLLNPQWTAQVPRATAPETGRATRRIGFAGGAPGVNTMLRGTRGWTLIILANPEPPAAEAVDQAVFSLLVGPPPA